MPQLHSKKFNKLSFNLDNQRGSESGKERQTTPTLIQTPVNCQGRRGVNQIQLSPSSHSPANTYQDLQQHLSRRIVCFIAIIIIEIYAETFCHFPRKWGSVLRWCSQFTQDVSSGSVLVNINLGQEHFVNLKRNLLISTASCCRQIESAEEGDNVSLSDLVRHEHFALFFVSIQAAGDKTT